MELSVGDIVTGALVISLLGTIVGSGVGELVNMGDNDGVSVSERVGGDVGVTVLGDVVFIIGDVVGVAGVIGTFFDADVEVVPLATQFPVPQYTLMPTTTPTRITTSAIAIQNAAPFCLVVAPVVVAVTFSGGDDTTIPLLKTSPSATMTD